MRKMLLGIAVLAALYVPTKAKAEGCFHINSSRAYFALFEPRKDHLIMFFQKPFVAEVVCDNNDYWFQTIPSQNICEGQDIAGTSVEPINCKVVKLYRLREVK